MTPEHSSRNQISTLMSTFLFVQRNRRLRNRSFFRQIRKNRLAHLYRMHKLRSRLCEERMLCTKMLASWVYVNAFNKRSVNHPLQWWEKTVKTNFDDSQWIKHFKMKKATFVTLVEDLKSQISHSSSIPVDKKVAVTLLSLASGKRLEGIADLFGMSKSEVFQAIKETCNALMKIFMSLIKVPEGDTLNAIVSDFEIKWGFPQCAGALGSIHVPIRMSKLPENSSDYINSGGSYSIHLQGIVDPTYKFWDINIGWPGGVKESRVLTSSALFSKGQEGKLFPNKTRILNHTEVQTVIIANSTYPLTNWIIRPYMCSEASPTDEIRFNENLCFAHSVSEIAFKRLKARWNCLVLGNTCNIDMFPSIVTACCILHNICENAKEPLFNGWIIKAERLYRQPLPSPCCSIMGSNGEVIQNAFKNYFQEQYV